VQTQNYTCCATTVHRGGARIDERTNNNKGGKHVANRSEFSIVVFDDDRKTWEGGTAEARGWDTLQRARIKRALFINAAAAAASRRRRASLASGCPLRVAADGYER
jgi:hypothetical protein